MVKKVNKKAKKVKESTIFSYGVMTGVGFGMLIAVVIISVV